MKNKLFVPIMMGIYLLSLGAGFVFAGYQHSAAITPTPPLNHQATWIMIRVDDMTIENPHLVSVWAMFLTFSPGPQIYFKPIYSANTASPSAQDLGNLFSVTADRQISDRFIAGLDRLQIHRTGLVILDEAGYQSFTSWFKLAAGEEAQPIFNKTSAIHPVNQSPEARAYADICKALSDQDAARLSPLPWDQLAPNHVLSHPSLENLSELWEKIISSGIPAHCEVIPNL